jgi:hypothetical protein
MKIPSGIPLVNPLVIKKYYYRGIYRRNGADKFIFLLPTDLPTEKNYRRKIHRRNISVGDSVGKLITDGICVLHRRKNSIGKIVISCSVCTFFSFNRKRWWDLVSTAKIMLAYVSFSSTCSGSYNLYTNRTVVIFGAEWVFHAPHYGSIVRVRNTRN